MRYTNGLKLVTIVCSVCLVAACADRNTQLREACKRGDLGSVTDLIAQGADVNAQNPAVGEGTSPLIAASSFGHVEVVRTLLAKGARLQAKNVTGWTALTAAASKGHLEVVSLLLERDADPNARAWNGLTCFMIACRRGHLGVAKLLVEKGARVASRDWETRMPLFFLALLNGFPDTAQFLLRKGADINATNPGGKPLLHWTLLNNQPQLVNWLLDHGADANSTDPKTGLTILEVALDQGSGGIPENLITKGADVDRPDRSGATLLHRAALRGQVETARFLLEHGANPNAADRNRDTPLMNAIQRKHLDMTRLILEKGCDVNHKNCRG